MADNAIAEVLSKFEFLQYLNYKDMQQLTWEHKSNITWTNKDLHYFDWYWEPQSVNFFAVFLLKKDEEGDLVAEGVIDDRIEKKCLGE